MTTNEMPDEEIPPGETVVVADLVKLLDGMQRAGDPTKRSQHAKGHGCLEAEFRIPDKLPEQLRHGLFAKPQSYRAWVRVSNAFAMDDRLPDFHGIAIKLLPQLDEAAATEIDFLLIDTPIFFVGDPQSLLTYFHRKGELLAAGTQPGAVEQEMAKEFPAATAILGKFTSPGSCPFAKTYSSVVPYQFGPHIVKYQLIPEPAPTTPASPVDSADGIRAGMIDRLTTKGQGVGFRFEVQLREDPATMPIEDATVEWHAPFTPIATLHIAPQTFAAPDRDLLGETLSFDPWHTLPEHRPLGGLNRSRQAAYPAGVLLRREMRENLTK